MILVFIWIFSLFWLVACNLLLSHFDLRSLSLSIKRSFNHAIKRAEFTNLFVFCLNLQFRVLTSVQYIYVSCPNKNSIFDSKLKLLQILQNLLLSTKRFSINQVDHCYIGLFYL